MSSADDSQGSWEPSASTSADGHSRWPLGAAGTQQLRRGSLSWRQLIHLIGKELKENVGKSRGIWGSTFSAEQKCSWVVQCPWAQDWRQVWRKGDDSLTISGDRWWGLPCEQPAGQLMLKHPGSKSWHGRLRLPGVLAQFPTPSLWKKAYSYFVFYKENRKKQSKQKTLEREDRKEFASKLQKFSLQWLDFGQKRDNSRFSELYSIGDHLVWGLVLPTRFFWRK